MTKNISILWMAWLVGIATIASAQSALEDTEEEVLVSVDVGYNSAYRDKTWVPIDVFVVNEQSDLQGMVEVRTYDAANNLQSPIYRIPADCPRDSRKRFRLMAYLDRASRVEAWVYEKGRPAIDTPAYMEVSPIRDVDLLGLMLDNEPLDYTFLNIAVDRANDKARFFRQSYLTPDLPSLPDHIKAYAAIDFVMIGDIDPSRVSLSHRDLLRDYVETGGTVIVLTGLLAQRFSGTWVEELAGVEFGETMTLPEIEAGAFAFAEEDREGLRNNQEIAYTSLGVSDSGMTLFGHDSERPLAVRRRLGAGNVCTLAVDAGTHAFQENPAYLQIWSQMVFAREDQLTLNFDLYSSSASQLIPSLSGVEVRPLSFLLTYLGLYIGIGIIANWLFWNYLKRREMAWVCLIVFSAGFSAYAFVEGTAGWAKSAAINQIDVVHLRPNTTKADHFGLTGVLTSHTRNYEGTLQNDSDLIRDVRAVSTRYNAMPRSQRTPFLHVQGEPPRVERFVVGAAELRFMAEEGQREVQGGIEGELIVDGTGIFGTIQNNTDLKMDNYALFYDGAFVPVNEDDNGLQISYTHGLFTKLRNDTMANGNEWMFFYGNWGRQGHESVFTLLRRALITDSLNYQVWSHYPPLLFGWRDNTTSSAVGFEREMELSIATEMLVAEVGLKDLRISEDDPRDRIQLLTSISEYINWRYPNLENFNEWRQSYGGQDARQSSLMVNIPNWLSESENTPLELTVYVSPSRSDDEIKFLLRTPTRWSDEPTGFHDAYHIKTETLKLGNRPVIAITYRIDEWKELVSPQNSDQLELYLSTQHRESTTERNINMQWCIVANAMPRNPYGEHKEWPGWQSSKSQI